MTATATRTVTDAEAAKAADVIERVKPKMQKLRAELEPAEKVMKTWFAEHPDRDDFRSRIGISRSTQERLDTDKVKVHLGDKLAKFMKTVPVAVLSILNKGR